MKRAMPVILGLLIIAMFAAYIINNSIDCRTTKIENADLKQQIQAMQQEQEAYIEGEYTLITDLSSSIYLNSIPASLVKEQRWEDVNGVWFFDITKEGTHYRYVEGHIEWPQLALYAPNMHMEVISDSKWPKE